MNNDFRKKYLKYKYKYLSLKKQIGGNKYKIYKIKNIEKSNVGLKAFSKYDKKVLYRKYGTNPLGWYDKDYYERRIFSSYTHPKLLFLEWMTTSDEGPIGGKYNFETTYYCRINDLTDEQIKNTDTPHELFAGGEFMHLEDEGTLEEIYTKLNISN